MSDCCTPGSGFPNAATMQQLATNYPVVWEEICMIQQAILAASSQCQVGGGQMCTTVGGNTPMTFITGVNSVTVVNGGSGYVIDVPSVRFIPPVGVSPSITANGTVTTNGGNILSIDVTNGGSDYSPVSSTLSVISGTGNGANLVPLVDAQGQIVNINIVSGGTGYTLGDTITATRAVLPNIAYVDAEFVITTVSNTGAIVDVGIINPGSGYQDSVTTVDIVSSIDPLLPYPIGGGFSGTVLVNSSGVITGVVIDNVGSGYADLRPQLVITDPGTGAETLVTLSESSVASISVTESGTQYTSSATGTVLNPPTAEVPTTPATVTINTSVNTFGTNPNLYWQVWSGTATNKPIQLQLNSVISYFKGLGYNIVIQTNPGTGSTIQWYICW